MIAGASGLALFIFMFVGWFGLKVEAGGFEAETTANAWEWFSFIDILLFLAAIVAVALAVLRALGNVPTLPYPPAMIVAIAGAVALVLVLFRLIFPGDAGTDADGVEATRKIGVFLGLIASAGIAYGGYTAMNERANGEASPAA